MQPVGFDERSDLADAEARLKFFRGYFTGCLIGVWGVTAVLASRAETLILGALALVMAVMLTGVVVKFWRDVRVPDVLYLTPAARKVALALSPGAMALRGEAGYEAPGWDVAFSFETAAELLGSGHLIIRRFDEENRPRWLERMG